MVNLKTKIRILTVLAATLLLFAFGGTANASSYNFGELDVQPVETNGATTKEWFVEYLKPGENRDEQIRVSNMSSQEKHLELYIADTSTNDKNSYTVRPFGKQQEDLNDWITLATKDISLKAGESTIININIQTPTNAGIGLHTGGVMVREIITDRHLNAQYATEKGVRIYLNVIGTAITQAETTSLTVRQSAGQITAESIIRNTGTTDFHPNFKIQLQDLSGATVAESSYEGKVNPQVEQPVTASVNKPEPGFYQITVQKGDASAVVGSIVIIPAWIPLLLLATIFAYAIMKKPKTAITKTPEIIITTVLDDLQQGWNHFAFQRTLVFIGIIAVSAGSTLYFATIHPPTTSAQDTQNNAAAYELTVKWGNFRNFRLPENYHKTWDGKISVSNATMNTQSLRDFETTDSAEIVENGTAMNFNVSTGPDNDGITLNILPTGENTPTVTYLDNTTGETFKFKITDYLNSEGVYPFGVFSTYFSVTSSQENAISNAKLVSNGPATPEAEANIPELNNLFTQSLPATPEVLADFILNSNYIKEISTKNMFAEVTTDKILMNALSATPEVLANIAATPDLNFIFIPNEVISFPTQDFSFNDEKLSTREIGTMIFVMNKKTPWNTYVTSTDFHSLSSDAIIPVTALTIIPGKAEILSANGEDSIQTGPEKTFSSNTDKAVLVNIEPNSGENTSFILRPILQIRLPAGTLPGRYEGILTISSL